MEHFHKIGCEDTHIHHVGEVGRKGDALGVVAAADLLAFEADLKSTRGLEIKYGSRNWSVVEADGVRALLNNTAPQTVQSSIRLDGGPPLYELQGPALALDDAAAREGDVVVRREVVVVALCNRTERAVFVPHPRPARQRRGRGWSDWKKVGGNLRVEGAPSVARGVDGRMRLFVRGVDHARHQMLHRIDTCRWVFEFLQKDASKARRKVPLIRGKLQQTKAPIDDVFFAHH